MDVDDIIDNDEMMKTKRHVDSTNYPKTSLKMLSRLHANASRAKTTAQHTSLRDTDHYDPNRY